VRNCAAAVALVTLTATVLAVADASAQQRPPGPPPLALRSATLHRSHRAIELRMQAMSEVRVRVEIRRHGRRLGRRPAAVHQGRSIVPVAIRRALLRHLRAGQHVDVIIEFGGPQPVVIYGVVLHRRHAPPSLLVA
jgi:invasion protein IalB